jgi:hypothetical protein
VLVPVLVFAAAFGSSYAAELTQQTLASWDSCIDNAKLKTQKRLTVKSPFLWVDENPLRSQQLNSGEIVVTLCAGFLAHPCQFQRPNTIPVKSRIALLSTEAP